MTPRTLTAAIGATALAAGTLGLLIGRASESTVAPTPTVVPSAPEPATDRITMSDAQIRAASIGIEQVAGASLDAEILAQAVIVSSPEGEAVLAARADGAVTRINKRLGDSVTRGETVAAIESREASTIAAQQATASAAAEAARAAYAREQRLFVQRITAQQDLETARNASAAAEAELKRTRAAALAAGVSRDGRTLAVTSPIAGRISKATAVLGAYVTSGQELFRVADPARIEVQASVPAADAAKIAIGDRALIETAEGTQFRAVVRAVTPGVDIESRAATVLLRPVAASPLLVPGRSLRVRLTPRQPVSTSALTVSADAVQTVDGREVVFVRSPGGFVVRPVTVGERGGDRVEISGGVAAGQLIAGRNAFLIKAQLAKSAEPEGGE